MTSPLRHFVGLVAAVSGFVLVIGLLIWGWRTTIDTHADRSQHLFAASERHLVNALLGLEKVIVAVSRDASSGRRTPAVPYWVELEATISAIDSHLTEVVRLAHEYDYGGAFGLQTRAYRLFESLRRLLTEHPEARPGAVTTLLAALGPLRDALTQLERIYARDRLDWEERGRDVARASTRNMMLAAVALVLIAIPLLSGMTMSLRAAMRRESRIRLDLEDAKRSLEQLAWYDDLTGLANRRLFKLRLEQEASAARRSQGSSALLYIDLDNFKRVNDSLGHDVGDEVLKRIGSRIEEQVRSSDTVSRIGGDEFAVIVGQGVDRETTGSIAQKLLAAIREPVVALRHELVLSASIGIAVMPADGDEPATLMKHADMALYGAKDLGRNNFRFYEETMRRAVTQQTRLERELRAAILEQRFELHYQPQIALDTGEVTCLEALLRWSTSGGEQIPPGEFIPVAESTGLLIEIGDWVFGQACRDLAQLRASGRPALRVSVNLSARQLHDPLLLERVESALSNAGLPPDALEVEITESTLIEDIDTAVSTLQALRQLGVTVAVDDFGTGYSSLSYLKQLPVDSLKIDRSFVRDIERDEDDRSIVDAILAMARSLSLKVVAEGIETPWQLDYMTRRGCDSGQGFLFAKPAPRDALALPSDALPPERQGLSTSRGGLHLV